MKRDLHNLKLGFIQLKRNVHFESTDHDYYYYFGGGGLRLDITGPLAPRLSAG